MTDEQAAQLAAVYAATLTRPTLGNAGPAACFDSNGNRHVFYRNPDDGTLRSKFNDDGSFSLGGSVTDAIAAIAGPDGTVDVFAYAPDGFMWQRHWNGPEAPGGGWDDWWKP